MKLIDATRNFGSVGILLPLILIFLIAADATYACPGSQTRVVYRTSTLNSRTVPLMGTTVITYRGTPSARCGDNAYVTRPVKYVAVRRTVPRYAAVSNADSYYPMSRARYIAVRSNEMGYAPARYVVVRRQPAKVESRTRYIAVGNGDIDDASRYVPVGRYSNNAGIITRYAAVRSGYRTGNGIVGYVDVNDAPRYVAVRRQPVYDGGTQYVAVSNVDSDNDVIPARYVAVRNINNACACAVGLRSSLDDVEAVSPRHVVVKSDYLDGTQEVIVPNASYDDTADVALPSESVNRTSVGYTNAAYVDDNGETIIPVSNVESPCAAPVALRTCDSDTGASTISYVRTYDDNNFDDQAVLDTGGATYIANNDVGDACLSRVAVQASPMEINTRAVNYVPVNYVDDDASLVGSGATYIANEIPASTVQYVPVIDDADVTNVAVGDVANNCSCPVALRANEGDLGAEAVSYVPVNDVRGYGETVSYLPVSDTSMRTVSYVPVEDVADTNTTTVTNVPADEMDAEDVSDMPADSVDNVDTAAVAADENSMPVSSVETVPPEVVDDSTALVNESDSGVAADLVATQQAAGEVGYRDGLADGRNAALNLQENRPGESENFQMATNGYGNAIGDMDIYKDAYRSSYLQGFSAGYDSVTGSE
jgi:hypothetical protein